MGFMAGDLIATTGTVLETGNGVHSIPSRRISEVHVRSTFIANVLQKIACQARDQGASPLDPHKGSENRAQRVKGPWRDENRG